MSLLQQVSVGLVLICKWVCLSLQKVNPNQYGNNSMLHWLDSYSMSSADLVNHVHNIPLLQLLLTHGRMTMPAVCEAGEKLSLNMWPNTMNSFNFPNLI